MIIIQNQCADNTLVKVCSDRHILGHSEKAIRVRVGQSLYGDPIDTWYPKRYCQVKYTATGYDIYVPAWINNNRVCQINSCGVCNQRQETTMPVQPGFCALPI